MCKKSLHILFFVVYYLEWKSGQICPFMKKDNCNRKGIFKFLEELL